MLWSLDFNPDKDDHHDQTNWALRAFLLTRSQPWPVKLQILNINDFICPPSPTVKELNKY